MLASELPRVAVEGALGAAGVAVLLAVLASAVPATLAGRLPLATVLARG